MLLSMNGNTKVKYLKTDKFGELEANRIAYQKVDGSGSGLVWCGGLKSDMDGTKAQALHDWAAAQGRAYVRFDYFGHGRSSGAFRDGTISRWAADTIQVIDELTVGPQILIGSSMGGWTALLAGLARRERVSALVLIAPAPDFTEKLMWAGFDETIRNTIMQEGLYLQPSEYEEPYEISRDLIVDGRQNLLLDAPIAFDGPVRILQGRLDTSVPWQHALRLVDLIDSEDIEFTLVKSGDHSLSSPHDLKRLIATVEALTLHA